MFLIPINIMLKDNADDIKEKVFSTAPKHPVIKKIQDECSSITKKYVNHYISDAKRIGYEDLKGMVDAVFIALHGRPGEDGAVQARLEKLGIPYNGSGVKSSQTTINKFETNRILREHGILVANHMMILKEDWDKSNDALVAKVEQQFHYPIIAKPSDDGCSSAVKKIKSREELVAYIKLMFGFDDLRDSVSSRVLGLKQNEEFPQKTYFVIEDLISKGNAAHFLEVTGGMLTHLQEDGSIRYEIFEPSEALSTGDVLSLEEKFLAGEGQNITPPRFAKDAETYKIIAEQVKDTLKKTAEILNVVGYCRIDAFVRIYENNKAETIIIEVNSLPGMTPATCIFHQTALNGYKPYDFIDRILTFGMQRQTKALATH